MPTTEARAHSGDSDPPLTTRVETLDDTPVVHVAGEIDISTVGDLEATIRRSETQTTQEGQGNRVIVIDLRGVTFLGAEGLRSLVASQNRIAAAGGTMRVVVPGEGGVIRRLLELSGVESLLDLFESVEAAIAPDRP